MFISKVVFFHFVCFFILDQTTSLVELPQVEDNDIVKAESRIRETINKLFFTLRLKKIKNRTFFKYSTIHNYFVSLTLQDYESLKEIAQLTRVDYKSFSNQTKVFIEVFNSVNADSEEIKQNSSNVELEEVDDGVVNFVTGFLSNLDYLKDAYNVSKANREINEELLKILNRSNAVPIYTVDSDYEGNENESEFWRPPAENSTNYRRIYQGKRTKARHFSFLATVQVFRQFQCGGSIIKSDLIITAASCLQLAYNNRFFRENPEFLSVQVGSDFYHGGGEIIPVLEVYFHPSYSPKTLKNNLAILRLKYRVHFRKKHSKVKKIEIDRQDNALPVETCRVTIVGFGATTGSNIIYEPALNRLTYAVLDPYPLLDCQDIYSKEYVTHTNFCAGSVSKGAGACNRDVGNPGIVSGVLTGVVSFGSPVCGTPDAPTVFTKLGFYTDWIENIMEMEVYIPTMKQRTTLKPKMSVPIPKFQIPKNIWHVEPVEGKVKLEPVNNTYENVVFKQFLKTVFTSKEIDEYQDFIKEEQKSIERILDVKYPEKTTPTDAAPSVPIPTSSVSAVDFVPLAYATVVTDYDDPTTDTVEITEAPKVTEMVTVTRKRKSKTKAKKYTVMEDVDLERDTELQNDIVKLIDDVDLKEMREEEIVREDVNKEEAKENVTSEGVKEPEKLQGDIDDSILTLLYLTDDEKNGDLDNKTLGILERSDEDGLSIANFKDFTYKKRSPERNDLVSKQDLYDLLKDAIASESLNETGILL